MSGEEENKLVWPPTKEDLERLYLIEHLSAAKIAKAYGLKYASPKTAESTVLYQLKKNGIERRDKTAHLRKIGEEMVDDWAARYQAGESLSQIASGSVSPATVFLHLRRRGLNLRGRVEAQIRAVTKYQRRQFSGDLAEKAYLLGLVWGDLHASRHGRAVRAKTATTHPAMVELVRGCFEQYGRVNVSPRKSSLVGYEWSIQVDLDGTFGFLLDKYGLLPKWVSEKGELFQSFLAGLFDAEGSVYLNERRLEFEISISNQDSLLLHAIFDGMEALGFDSRLTKVKNSKLWRIYMWKPNHVRRFLEVIPLRHDEKRTKASLALLIQSERDPSRRELLLDMWDQLRANIKRGRDRFVDDARRRRLG